MGKYWTKPDQVYDAAERFWHSLPDDYHSVDDSQMMFLETMGADPHTMASLARIAINNANDPVHDVVNAARSLNINVGTMPDHIKNITQACGLWFHDTPILLVDDVADSAEFRRTVSVEIGALMVCRAALVNDVHGRHLRRLAGKFADAFLYPDNAVQELKHLPSVRRFNNHKDDFGIDSKTIFRRLLTVSKQ